VSIELNNENSNVQTPLPKAKCDLIQDLVAASCYLARDDWLSGNSHDCWPAQPCPGYKSTIWLWLHSSFLLSLCEAQDPRNPSVSHISPSAAEDNMTHPRIYPKQIQFGSPKGRGDTDKAVGVFSRKQSRQKKRKEAFTTGWQETESARRKEYIVQMDSREMCTHLLHTCLLDSKQRSRESKVLLLRGHPSIEARCKSLAFGNQWQKGHGTLSLANLTCGRIADIDGIRQSCENIQLPFKYPAGISESNQHLAHNCAFVSQYINAHNFGSSMTWQDKVPTSSETLSSRKTSHRLIPTPKLCRIHCSKPAHPVTLPPTWPTWPPLWTVFFKHFDNVVFRRRWRRTIYPLFHNDFICPTDSPRRFWTVMLAPYLYGLTSTPRPAR
jgi:hypothetical protein